MNDYEIGSETGIEIDNETGVETEAEFKDEAYEDIEIFEGEDYFEITEKTDAEFSSASDEAEEFMSELKGNITDDFEDDESNEYSEDLLDDEGEFFLNEGIEEKKMKRMPILNSLCLIMKGNFASPKYPKMPLKI